MNNFAKLIYNLRKEKKMTQAELGERLGLTDKAVSKWETGESYPETSQLISLSNLFEISIDELLKGEKKIDSNTIDSDEKYFETMRKMQKPLSVKNITFITVGAITVILSVIASVMLLVFKVDFPLWVVFPIVAVFACGAVLCVMVGLNIVINSIGLSDKQKDEGKLPCVLLEIGVFIFLMILAPIGLLFIVGEWNIGLIIAAACTFVASLPLLIVGGILFNQRILINIEIKEQPKMPKSYKWHALIWTTGVLLSLIIFIIAGVISNSWGYSAIAFPVCLLICAMLSSVIEIKKL